MADSKYYLAPLGLAVVGAILGIGPFGNLHETVFGSENEPKIAAESNYEDPYSYSTTGYGYNISFRNKKHCNEKHCNGTVGCDCPGFSPITNGDEWQKSYCRHCGHKKSCHK